MKNILLEEFDTPPFSKISNGDFLPAIEEGIARGLAQVDAIVQNPAEPSFENTVLALENSGETLDRVLGVFYPLLSADADDELMEISLKASAMLSDYSSKISLNEKLFQRIKAVYEKGDAPDAESRKLLEDSYLGFERSGANLQGQKRKRFREITARLSELTTKFGQNVKRELATYAVELADDQVDGLPDWFLEQMRENAKERKSQKPYVLTLQAPEYMAFMKLSPHAQLRRKVYMLYSARNTRGEFDNTDIVREIVALRLEKANLLGFKTFADFKLDRTMAGTPSAAIGLLDELRDAYMPALQRELAELREFAAEEITPWNYAYHSNRLRKERYDFDPETMRPYFELSKVTAGVFGLATRLYGIRFEERNDVDVYHPDVKVFEVRDDDGSSLGLLYADFFPRAGRKSPGAWMTDFREADGRVRPQVNIVMNFTKPSAERPSLLSPGEVTTFLHEFGHALHSLLTRARYKSQAGTNVDRDFVELPSQFNENFFYCREFLDQFGVPEQLYDRMIAARRFGAAYACVRQLNFGLLDFGFHTVEQPASDILAVERRAISRTEIFPPVDGTLIATSFGHIFAGGYAAGYYSYKWAEVLDADAFDYFEQNGTFNPALAQSFRKNILEKGGSVSAAALYEAFRGRAAKIDALLKRDGIEYFS